MVLFSKNTLISAIKSFNKKKWKKTRFLYTDAQAKNAFFYLFFNFLMCCFVFYNKYETLFLFIFERFRNLFDTVWTIKQRQKSCFWYFLDIFMCIKYIKMSQDVTKKAHSNAPNLLGFGTLKKNNCLYDYEWSVQSQMTSMYFFYFTT